MKKARRLWLQVHRWVGLTAGLVLVVVGLSGSFLAFYPEIDRQLNPDWLISKPVGKPLSMQQVIDAARAEMPERFLHSVFPAKHDTDVHHVWFTPSAQDQSAMWEVLVDPYTGQTLGKRAAVPTLEFTRRNLVNTIYTLHFQLFMGEVGASIVGFSGVFLFMSAMSGVVLWWPRNRAFKKGLLIKPGSHGIRLHYDIHRVAGIYSFLLLVVMAVTGIYLTFPDYVKPFVNSISSLHKPLKIDALPLSTSSRISADDALTLANKFAPSGHVKCLWLPGASGQAWRVSMTAEKGITWSGSPIEIWLHPQSGVLLDSAQHEYGTNGDKFVNWQLPLHSGKAFGTPGRIVVCVLGFIPLIMALTGGLIWLRKRKVQLAVNTHK
jgi:uncharacterized iron-regulated membrane protein